MTSPPVIFGTIGPLLGNLLVLATNYQETPTPGFYLATLIPAFLIGFVPLFFAGILFRITSPVVLCSPLLARLPYLTSSVLGAVCALATMGAWFLLKAGGEKLDTGLLLFLCLTAITGAICGATLNWSGSFKNAT